MSSEALSFTVIVLLKNVLMPTVAIWAQL